MNTISVVSGLADLADRYDAFIIDLWGVLHDGAAPYPGAIDSLTRLRAAGKAVVLLSNAPRPSDIVARRLDELGFARDLYDAVMTSGQQTWRHLKDRPDEWYQGLGQACYMLGPEKDKGILDGLELNRVASLDQASFILNTGADFGETLDQYEPLLRDGVARGLPMICANPDLVVIHQGNREICAGALAAHYESLGGTVRYHGKPHADVYEVCFNLMPSRPAAGRTLGIGDSLRTDIAGARAAGIDSLFVIGGIHAQELGVAEGDVPPVERLTALCRAADLLPTHAVGRFVWAAQSE